MTDYATTNITPALPPDPPLVGVIWEQNTGQSFVAEMKATPTPRTPVLAGTGGTRPSTGLVFPR